MPSDLIYREDAKVFVRHACYKKINPIDYLDEVPAADVRPVVKGTWKTADSYAGPGLMNLRCSVCGEFGGTWKDSTLPSMLYNFCPNCGADCRGGNDGK